MSPGTHWDARLARPSIQVCCSEGFTTEGANIVQCCCSCLLKATSVATLLSADVRDQWRKANSGAFPFVFNIWLGCCTFVSM
eukprot:5606647-Amphidinium_carterae.1